MYTNVLSHVSWIRGNIGEETRVMCRTRDGRVCQFPFTFQGTTYTSCTTDDDPGGEAWCSTRVDARGRHVSNGGHWGHCSDTCRAASADLVQVTSNVVENEGDVITVKEFVFCVFRIINHLNNKSLLIFCLSALASGSHQYLGLTN